MKIKKRKQDNVEYVSYDHQTRMSWAELLNGYSDVPVDFLPFFQSMQESEQPFPYSVIAPSYNDFSYRAQKRLVCLIDNCLYIANKGEDISQALCLQYKDIQHIEFGTVLLDSILHITGVDQKGQPVQIEIRFNSSSELLFKNIIDTIRQSSNKSTEPKEAFSFKNLKEANFKMANYSRYCLLKDENVDQLIWQPELRKSRIRINMPSLVNTFLYHTVFPHHIAMLTDHELIFIRESARIVSNDCYGGIWDYIPLSKITDASISRDEDEYVTLKVELPNDQLVETLYLPSLHNELEQMVNKINQN